MNLKILLPFKIFAEVSAVTHIVAETPDGSFGILPHRLDCVAALVPGIFAYSTCRESTVHVAVDAGVLVKSGTEVLVSVRRAVAGNLADLHETVRREFSVLDANEREARAAVARMESGLIGRLAEYRRGS